MNDITVRPVTAEDAETLRGILNTIIIAGGTTAIENPLTRDEFHEYFMPGDKCVSCLVAEFNGRLLGFQVLESWGDLADGWIDIASFTDQEIPVKGAGRALFRETRRIAREMGYKTINATIRADNVPGQGYYGKMGFEIWRTVTGAPLSDGTPVDRIKRRFDLY